MSTMEAIDHGRLAPAEGERIAIVGVCGGIGRQLEEAFRRLGIEVVGMDIERAIRDSGKHSRGIIPIDVSEPASVKAAFANIGSLNGLVYLAGYSPIPPRNLTELTEDTWIDVINTNLSGAYRVAMASLPLLKNSDGQSAIVAVSSTLGTWALPGFGAYTAAKSGLEGLVKALAVESAPKVRVNAIAPSAMETPFVRGGLGRAAGNEGENWFDAAKYSSGIPMGRLATVEDVIGPILFLLGPGSQFVTAQVLTVSGGRHMR